MVKFPEELLRKLAGSGSWARMALLSPVFVAFAINMTFAMAVVCGVSLFRMTREAPRGC